MRDPTDPSKHVERPETSDTFAAIAAIRERLLSGCSAEEFAAMICPVCGATLYLNVHPNHSTFHVRCTIDSTHLSFHDTSNVKPAWWVSHMRGGWY